MLLDARTLDDGTSFETDICIIGGGPAGLAVAHALRGKGIDVVLLEGGGRDWDRDDQALYWGESVGRPYLPLDGSRWRCLGGNSHVWGGWCAPYRDHAFDALPYVPHSGWPLVRSEIDPWIARAAALVGIPEPGFDAAYWHARAGAGPPPLRQGVFEHYVELIQKTRFALTLGSDLERHAATRLVLHANLWRIETDDAARRVEAVVARTREDGRRLRVRARHYILAMGGIENARQLLLADQVNPAGLGNDHGIVGRFFADHVSFHGGLLQLPDPGHDVGFFLRHRLAEAEFVTQLFVPWETARQAQVLRGNLLLRPIYDSAWEGPGMRSLRTLRVDILHARRFPDDLGGHLAAIARDMGSILGLGRRTWQAGQLPIAQMEILSSVAPAPNPESRVFLGETTDELGLRHVALDWRLSPIDKRSARFALETFAAEAGAAGLGRVQVLLDDDDETFDDVFVEPACHHMGTTRMATDPRHGVVDPHCRVHGMANLHIAGSSVFPSAGDGSPTLMLLALALRLADRLEEV